MLNLEKDDEEELKKYIPIADAIAQTFGENCEVVLHDLSSPQNSVVYTVNNHVTGREVGQPFDHIIKHVLLSKQFRNDLVANYRTDTAEKSIKSTTVLLRNSNGKAIGAFCINYDLTPINNMKQFMENFMPLEQDNIEGEVEVLGNVREIVDDLINKIVHQSDIEKMDRSQRIELVKFMNEKGVFLIKGSMEKVAEEFKISKVTLYSYLEEIKKIN